MSEAPTKDTPVAEPTVVEPTTAAEPTVAAPETTAATAETPAAVLPTEENVGEDAVKIEAQPASEGVLGYKAPGLIKSLRFSKKFFWFGDEQPIDEKHLSSYLQNEKPAIAHPAFAHATQTGKGLLFFAKRVEDKTSPTGIINLGEASSVTKEGVDAFSFTLHAHKHTFQAASKAESDSWVVAIESHITEAKAAHQDLIGSEGYKKSLSKFAGSATTDKTATPAKTDKVHDGTPESSAVTATATPAEATATAPKAAEKSRSQSRKRQSIFGKVLGKKDEAEEKKEEKTEVKEAKKEEKAEEKETKKEEKAEAKEAKKEEKAVEKKEEKAAETAAPKPKRASVFGSFFKRDSSSPTREKKEKEVAPVVPAKDAEVTPAVAPVAPQLDPVATTAEAPSETVVAPVPATATTPEAASKEKRRQSFFTINSSKKEKKEGAISDTEVTDGEGKKPTSGKLGGIFRRVSRSAKGAISPSHDETTAPPLPSKDVAAVEPTTEAAAVPETNGAVEPAVEKPAEPTVPESTASAPAVSASA